VTSASIYFKGRLHRLALLSIPSGAPLGWVFNTFQYFLVDLGISRAQIGLLSSVSLPWSLKFLWAPLVDRFAPAGPRRRAAWMLAMLVGLAATFAALASIAGWALDARAAGALPASVPLVLGLVALAVALLSATFDIAYDAQAVEVLRPDEHAVAPGLRSAYYFVGFLLAGAVAVSLADRLGWPGVFALLAGLFALCIPLVLISPLPEASARARRTLRAAVVEPFASYFRRPDAWALAAFLVTYKFGDNLAGTMVNPFLRDLCFTNAEAGLAVKGAGVAATIVGGLAGGAVILRLGLWRSLWVLGAAQALANLLYAAAALDRDVPLAAALCRATLPPLGASTRAWAYVAIAGEYFTKAMAGAAQGALLLKVCDRANAMTQFALLSSLFALGRWLAGLPSGVLVEALGYPLFFTLCATAAAAPGLYFLARLGRLEVVRDAAEPAGAAK
jgi:PAT family beta-lactamase induction signal transducer AmpG